MQTSLRRIAEKAVLRKEHRFQNLSGELTPEYLCQCYRELNKKAAPGADRMTVSEYGRNLSENIADLVRRLKRGGYRAKLILRRFIPKAGGKKRPLGLPATEDKILQTAVAGILGAIYEPIFRNCSFGYRLHIGAKDAVKDISKHLQLGGFNFVVEADIRGFFDNIDHEVLMGMLAEKVDDRRFLRLVRKWPDAGILEEDGKITDPVTGTPQGGVISPVLANICLHYAIDEWFEDAVKAHCRGQVCLCRYADDFVCAFRYQDDAEKFYRVLGKRLEKFGLSLADEKTRIIRFSRLHPEESTYFEFLGFGFRWGTDRRGRPQIWKRTSRKKYRASLKNFSDWCRKNRHRKMTEFFKKPDAKLRGYYNYYGVRGNYKSLSSFFFHAMRILSEWLNKRSHRKSYNWEGFHELLKYFRIERPRITEKTERIQHKLYNAA